VLGGGHEFYVREPHVLGVGGQRLGEFAIAERFEFVLLHPGTEMHFVYAHRAAEWIAGGALLQPGLVFPFEFGIVQTMEAVWALFRRETVGVGFQNKGAVVDFYLEFVLRAFANAGDENFPNA